MHAGSVEREGWQRRENLQLECGQRTGAARNGIQRGSRQARILVGSAKRTEIADLTRRARGARREENLILVPRYRSGPKVPSCVLQKGKKGLEFNNLACQFAS